MVTRASSVPHSINKINTSRNRKPQQTPPKHKDNVPRSRSLNNGIRQRNSGGSSSNDRSRNTPVFLRSRDNEIGSADTLEIVASKSTGSEPSTPDDNINVVVRVRPLNEKEKRGNPDLILQFPGNGQVLIEGQGSGTKASRNRENVKVYTYNVVFEPGATQDDILDYSGVKRIIEMAMEGFSCTAFCYGQTGSGKTHTLTGPPELFAGKPNPKDRRHGLIFRSFLYLFQLIKNRKETNFILKASFLEIYNEKVIDLLNPGSARKPLAVRWSKKSGGFFVENLFTVDCEELDDLLAVLEEGMRNRATGCHQMNEHSSRSHTILTVHIISEQQAGGNVFISKHGKINFVDLAGSELTKKTLSEGKTLEEANNINKSLMVLGYCIASLSDTRKRSGHIPYRDSQLTKLLADSLAGNGVTLMIACVSPSQYNYAETLNTLRYAARAKLIRTKPVIMMDPREALILSLKRDIHSLELENDHLKTALNLHHETHITSDVAVTTEPNVPKVPLERLSELEGSDLADLVKLYMQENETLRQENSHLCTIREIIMRDQEIVCRENERLLKKLEDVNKVCVRSPLIPSRPALSSNSGSEGDTEIWTNPRDAESPLNKDLVGRISENKDRISEEAQRAIDKRRIGKNILHMADNFRMYDDKKRQNESEYMPDMLV
ncbi:kinesin-like protein KIF12 [Episyrphus balteatus]|uniref:kinesin-like protein KIF12 n=1 Tax=Episyrphus balteatus TaxID=286459 RepID=UPI002485E2A1|nr:kinesin-like protein KIF12 [Episyrphus balteatus]